MQVQLNAQLQHMPYPCLTLSSFSNNSPLGMRSLLSSISKVLKLATLCDSSDNLFASEGCQLFQGRIDYRWLHAIKSTDNDAILSNHENHCFNPPYQLFIGRCSLLGCKRTAGFPTTPATFW